MTTGSQVNEAPSVDRRGADVIEDLLFAPGGVERRMHSRAYHHWITLLGEAPYPLIERLDPTAIADFAAHSVLLDFRGGEVDPRIAYIGRELREECGLASTPDRVAALPERSLLTRLTGRYGQMLASQAPAGFEAEFVNARDRTTLYRGVLLPFSSDGRAIDFVYGVVNWKELADPLLQATIDSQLSEAMAAGNGVSRAGGRARGDGNPWSNARNASPPTVKGHDSSADTAAPMPGPIQDSIRRPILGHVAFPVDAPPGSSVVLVGQIGEDGRIIIQGQVVGDTRLSDRVLRAANG